MEKRNKEKEAFFKSIDGLAGESDTGEEEEKQSEAPGILQSVRRTYLYRNRQSLNDGTTLAAPGEGRSNSFPITRESISPSSSGSKSITRSNSKVLDAPALGPQFSNQTLLQKSHTEPLMKSTGSNPTTVSKRKRDKTCPQRPGSEQIFKYLNFYFIPNDDFSPARRMRINKAQEYGASWVRSWNGRITHVIVDRDLSYKDVISFLKIESLPASIILVNEGYPADCIIFRSIINPKQIIYQVDGAQEVTHPGMPSSRSSTDDSLPLKPEKGKLVQPPQTPSQTEESIKTPEILDENNITSSLEDTSPHAERPQSPVNIDDGLEQAINEARATHHLPLDEDEDEYSSPPSTDTELSSDIEVRPKRAKVVKASFEKSWQQQFTCMQKHDGLDRAENPNSRTIEVLLEMATYYDRMNDHWRTTAYRKAISALRNQKTKIATKEQAAMIPFIGERLALKIEEIVTTNRLRRLENTNLDPNDQVLQMFMNVYGAGLAQASQWVNQGYRSLTDLIEKADLTRNQRIGVQHYEDFLARIPRSEVEKHGSVVRKALQKIDKGIEVIIGGSYRRGARDSGDIDLIITKPDVSREQLRTLVLDMAIPYLLKQGFLKTSLATTSKDSGTKWHGASVLPGSSVWRRIDFLLVSWDQMGAALIYFTGNDIFNRSIRLLARRKGMRLNQRGLYRDVLRGAGGEKVNEGLLLEGKDEKRIFDLLGVPWRPPEHRVC
ncbi:MAG: hypothetical protein M1834_005746 [Cirrosporium novae-zelandiae]|nr:MAG: hypothetical protein M1834_005746 [Cirrosporium novae-zelandiae]